MMNSRGAGALLAALCGFGVFAALVLGRGPLQAPPEPDVNDRVVISAPVQVVLAAGDRFLAADFETIRVMATADEGARSAADTASFRIRAHRVIAQLNPCHEDNYYVANAVLSWGGASSEAQDVLRRTINCRHWDEFPPFFYGINQWFFNRDGGEARRALEIAAERAKSAENARAMRRIGIMIEADRFPEEQAALAFLENERTQTSDEKLQAMLEARIQRLKGLVALREAQGRYEERMGRPLTHPNELISSGVLAEFPSDPLGLGYEFAEGRFRLREMKVPGFERRMR